MPLLCWSTLTVISVIVCIEIKAEHNPSISSPAQSVPCAEKRSDTLGSSCLTQPLLEEELVATKKSLNTTDAAVGAPMSTRRRVGACARTNDGGTLDRRTIRLRVR